MQQDRVRIVRSAACSGFLEALRDREIFDLGVVDQPPHIRDMLRIEILALEGNVRIGSSKQGKPKTLPEA